MNHNARKRTLHADGHGRFLLSVLLVALWLPVQATVLINGRDDPGEWTGAAVQELSPGVRLASLCMQDQLALRIESTQGPHGGIDLYLAQPQGIRRLHVSSAFATTEFRDGRWSETDWAGPQHWAASPVGMYRDASGQSRLALPQVFEFQLAAEVAHGTTHVAMVLKRPERVVPQAFDRELPDRQHMHPLSLACPPAAAAPGHGSRRLRLAISVADLDAARDFYADALALEHGRELHFEEVGVDIAMLHAPWIDIELIRDRAAKPSPLPSGQQHLQHGVSKVGWQAGDVEAAAQRLITAGARVLHGPFDDQGQRTIILLDPMGVVWHISGVTGAPANAP